MTDETAALPSGMADVYLREAVLAPEPAPAPAPTQVVVPGQQGTPAWANMPQPVYQPPSNNWQPPPQSNNWQQPAPQPAYTNPYGLADDQYATYQEALPVIQQVLKAEMQPLIEQMQYGQQMQEQQFVGQVRNAVQAFDQTVNDPRWDGYLSSRMPGSPFTYREALNHAHRGRDLSSMQSLFSNFQQGIGQLPNAQPIANNYPPNAMQPATQQNPAAAQAVETKLRWSVYQKASSAYQKGQLPRGDWLQVKALYDPAISAGTVDYAI